MRRSGSPGLPMASVSSCRACASRWRRSAGSSGWHRPDRRGAPSRRPRPAATWTRVTSPPGRASGCRSRSRTRCSASVTVTPPRVTARSAALPSRRRCGRSVRLTIRRDVQVSAPEFETPGPLGASTNTAGWFAADGVGPDLFQARARCGPPDDRPPCRPPRPGRRSTRTCSSRSRVTCASARSSTSRTGS